MSDKKTWRDKIDQRIIEELPPRSGETMRSFLLRWQRHLEQKSLDKLSAGLRDRS